MEEYLSVKEMSERTKLRRQTIYNMIYRGEFVLNKHYYKPKGKILFISSAIESWLAGDNGDAAKSLAGQGVDSPRKSTTRNNEASSIKI